MGRQLYHLTVNICAFTSYVNVCTHTHIKQELGEVGVFGRPYQRHVTAQNIYISESVRGTWRQKYE